MFPPRNVIRRDRVYSIHINLDPALVSLKTTSLREERLTFAVVTLDQMEVFENGSRSEPGVEPHIFDLDGRKLNVEKHYREMVGDEGITVLRKLRSEVVRLLNHFEIAVIPQEDLDKPVPWLRAGHDVFLGDAGEPITVRRAFFFHGP